LVFGADLVVAVVLVALRGVTFRRPPLSCVTIRFAPSITTPGTSPKASATKSSTWCTWLCTPGDSQTFAAVDLIWS
jgi:hypothetical protein